MSVNTMFTQATGVSVKDEVKTAFNAFKLQKGDYADCNFITFKITDNKKFIEIDRVAEPGEDFDDFVGALPEDDGRYGVVDVKFDTADGRSTSKLVFVSWVPDTMRVRSKMLYSGSKEYLKSSLEGIGICINCNDYSDIDYESVIKPTVLKYK